MSEDAGTEPRTVATSTLAVRRSNHSAKSHPIETSRTVFNFVRHQIRVSRRKGYCYLNNNPLWQRLFSTYVAKSGSLTALYIRPRLIQNRYVATFQRTGKSPEQATISPDYCHTSNTTAGQGVVEIYSAHPCVFCSHGGKKLLISVLPVSFPGFYGRL